MIIMDMFKLSLTQKIKRELNLLKLKIFARNQDKIKKLETDVEIEEQKLKLLHLKVKKKQLKQKTKKLKRKLRN
jgi:hypothetical protein